MIIKTHLVSRFFHHVIRISISLDKNEQKTICLHYITLDKVASTLVLCIDIKKIRFTLKGTLTIEKNAPRALPPLSWPVPNPDKQAGALTPPHK